MYYVGFFDTNPRKVVVFSDHKTPTRSRYPFFRKVLGPYKGRWEADDVVRFLSRNKYIDNPAKYCRERLVSPGVFDKKSFRTIRLGSGGKKGIVACEKRKYVRDRCKDGMRLQSILHPEGSEKCPRGGAEL